MSDSLLAQFERTIQNELDALFAEVRRKKQRIQALVAAYLAEEADLQHFITQYENHFRPLEATRMDLFRRHQQLERALHTLDRPVGETDTFWQSWAGDAPQATPENTANAWEAADLPDPLDDPLESEPGEPGADGPGLSEPPPIDPGALFGAAGGGLGDDDDPSDAAPAADLPLARGQGNKSPKRLVAEPFQWMYHPRQQAMSTDFNESRARLINELVDDGRYDEVDILLRLPFEPADEALWRAPLPNDGGSEDDRGRAQGALWRRFRLWNWLLDLALQRAEAIAAARPHPLYEPFQRWKASGLPSIWPFLEALEDERRAELNHLREQIRQLENELAARQADHPDHTGQNSHDDA